jgi:hypothetical protein
MNSEWMKRLGVARVWIYGIGLAIVVVIWLIRR